MLLRPIDLLLGIESTLKAQNKDFLTPFKWSVAYPILLTFKSYFVMS